VDLHPRSGQSPAHQATLGGKGDTMALRRSVPVPAPARGGELAASDLPGSADAGTVDLPTPIIRPYVAPSSRSSGTRRSC
ncbi:MAG: hypothetical protein NTX54_00760, partial [Chloroflexi bacterium]|nr:hypothetical protein [Chloroflexota bacterium]